MQNVGVKIVVKIMVKIVVKIVVKIAVIIVMLRRIMEIQQKTLLGRIERILVKLRLELAKWQIISV